MEFQSPRPTQSQPKEPSAVRCLEEMVSSARNNEIAMQSYLQSSEFPIRYFDDFTRPMKEQLDDRGAGRRHNFRPRCVSIGPCFHGGEGLERGEEIKRAAAHDFWACSEQPFSVLYSRVVAVASLARASYASRTDATDEEFTTMLFIDGCFLLRLIAYLTGEAGASLDSLSAAVSRAFATLQVDLLMDLFIVENQIPWVVLDGLMSLRPVQIMRFIDFCMTFWFDKEAAKPGHEAGQSANDYQPIHLLDLLYKRQLGPKDRRTIDKAMISQEVITITSASELAEAGVEICPSGTPRFADISFGRRWLVFGRLSMPPLLLSKTTLPVFLNMLAFELLYPDRLRGRMAAYVGMLTTLTSSEEDVRQLRRKGIVHTSLSDKDVMKLFKKLDPHVQTCRSSMQTFLLQVDITSFFKRQRPWITVHRFVYNNLKFLIIIGSLLSVSFSILKAILSLRDSPIAAPAAGQ